MAYEMEEVRKEGEGEKDVMWREDLFSGYTRTKRECYKLKGKLKEGASLGKILWFCK